MPQKPVRSIWDKFSIYILFFIAATLLTTSLTFRKSLEINKAASPAPVGALDTADGYVIRGWATDPDYNGALYVHIYIDGVLQQDILANRDSNDVGKHRFHWDIPPFGSGMHTVTVYAIGVDSNGYPDGNNPSLPGSPKTFNIGCARLQNHELEWCQGNSAYWESRQADTKLIWNNYVKVGINNSYGGLITQLYSSDRSKNLLEEHGGSAVQISIYNYDTSKGDVVAWFGQGRCDPTPYTSQQACLANNTSCVARTWSGGAHVADCGSVKTCNGVDAGWPWNPIQAIAGNCAWNSSANDVTYKAPIGNKGWEINHTNFYNYSKTSKFPNLSLNQKVTLGDVYTKITYTLDYSGSYTTAYHDAEMPAFFTSDDLNAYYYYYKGNSPYSDSNSAVTRVTNPPDKTGNLAFVEYSGPHSSWDTATERWWGVCDSTETKCITLASFNRDFITQANIQKFTKDAGSYIAPFAYFALTPGFNKTWEVYVFPYKHNKVIGGKTIRTRIFEIAATYGIHPSQSPTPTKKPTPTPTKVPTPTPTKVSTPTPTKKPTPIPSGNPTYGITPTPNTGKNPNPMGTHDPTTWQGCVVRGWACDGSNHSRPTDIHIYEGSNIVGGISANLWAEEGVSSQCGGYAYHRFSYNLPDFYRDGNSHTFTAYAIGVDNSGNYDGHNVRLDGSPQVVTCEKVALTPTQAPASTVGDANADGQVEIVDYAVWREQLETNQSTLYDADFNSDGVVDGGDYAIWMENYNN